MIWLRGGAAHDRVVHQQHVLLAELQRHRIELAAHRLHPLALPRHDEGAADVAVLDETLAERHAERAGQRAGRGARGIGNRDHRVDAVVGAQAQDLLAPASRPCAGAPCTPRRPRSSSPAAPGTRIRRCTACAARPSAQRRAVQLAGVGDDHRLARRDVAHALEAEHVERHRLGGHRVFAAFGGYPLAQHQRADAVGDRGRRPGRNPAPAPTQA